MKKILFALFVLTFFALNSTCPGKESSPVRIIVIDSYHPAYQWSQDVNHGLCDALLAFGYLDNKEQVEAFTSKDYAESSKLVISRFWMDTKRKSSKEEQFNTAKEFTKLIKRFKPDLILLGDDNATNYVGNQFLDTEIPIVFWGVNNTPVKYGLVDSLEKPGHNVTGVYQKTYYKESLELLKKIVPHVKTFAVLSDDTTTGRIHNKAIEHLDRKSDLPVKLAGIVATNDYEVWKNKALELQDTVDAFFIASSNGLKDTKGTVVSNEEVAIWYLKNITIPEATGFRYRVEPGWLCAADDSGYNQGYEAVSIAHDILAKGFQTASYPPRTPKRGPLMVNRQRAQMLGITLTKEMGIEEYIDDASVLNSPKVFAHDNKKILIIDSYNKEYGWSISMTKGLNSGMLELGFFDNEGQVEDFNRNDVVNTSRFTIKKLWLDSKRHSSDGEIEVKSLEFYKQAKLFKPDLIFLNDDNAAKYLGPKFLDSSVPVIFSGLNNTPVKYGLVDNKEKPGHNVTGVYQSGYFLEGFDLLQRIAPAIKSFAILSDGSTTSRNYTKAIEHLVQKKDLSLNLIETVVTSDYATWQSRALELQEKADAFFLSHFSSLRDKAGKNVSTDEVVKWYMTNITIPETVGPGFSIEKGFLCAVLDSGYNQAYLAAHIAFDVLVDGLDPATYKPRTPERGPKIANRKRAEILGIMLTDEMGIDRIYETSVLD